MAQKYLTTEAEIRQQRTQPSQRGSADATSAVIETSCRKSDGEKSRAPRAVFALRDTCNTPITFASTAIGALMIFCIGSLRSCLMRTPSKTEACGAILKWLTISARLSRAVRTASEELLVNGIRPMDCS